MLKFVERINNEYNFRIRIRLMSKDEWEIEDFMRRRIFNKEDSEEAIRSIKSVLLFINSLL